IRMPRVNGIELCRALRTKYNSSIKFIALTAHVFPKDKQALYDQGFDAVLTKPFHENELLTMLGVSSIKSNGNTEAAPYVVDLSPLRKMTMNDEALFYSVLRQFVEETQDDLQHLEEQLDQRDKIAIREIVHKLAGRIGQMGIGPLSLKLREVETKIIAGEEVEALMRPLIKLKEEVTLLLQKIKGMMEMEVGNLN